jgi:hypothetical protein
MERALLSSKIGRKFIRPREIPYPSHQAVFIPFKASSSLFAIREISPHSATGVMKR